MLYLTSPLKHGNILSALRKKEEEECGILFLVVHLLICNSFIFYNHFIFLPTWRIQFFNFTSCPKTTFFITISEQVEFS